MTVSLLEIMAAARSHAAPLAAESAGYLLLGVADHVVAAPRLVSPEDVELTPDGVVRLRAGAEPDRERAEQALRGLLGRTLEVSSSVGPALRRAAERRDDIGLAGLVRELEVALIPVNRGAAKRALSRLHRETERARGAGKLAPLLRIESHLDAAPVPEVSAPPAPPAPPWSEPAPAVLPAAVFAAPPLAAPDRALPPVELTLTPAPRDVEPEPAVTKPEPVVVRARERASSTPQLGTVVTAQTLPGEEAELTERAPDICLEDRAQDLAIDVDLEPMAAASGEAEDDACTPVRAIAVEPQSWSDPEPSQLPDVLTAMLELHTGIDADDAPTRLREVVTELLAVVQPVPLFTPEPQQVDDAWLTQSSLEDVATSMPAVEEETPQPLTLARPVFETELVDPELHEALTWNPAPVTPAPPEREVYRFESELAEPALHEALTWYPAPADSASPLPPALLVSEPAPSPSPYAPAVLPASGSDVSELADSFYVSGHADDAELRSALKEMAGLELTPASRPRVEER